MSFSFEQLIHPQPSLNHVTCISARQVAAAVVTSTATSSTISTGSTRTSTSTAKPISSTCKQDQVTHPAQPPPAK